MPNPYLLGYQETLKALFFFFEVENIRAYWYADEIDPAISLLTKKLMMPEKGGIIGA